VSEVGTPDFGGKQPGMGGGEPEALGGSPEAAYTGLATIVEAAIPAVPATTAIKIVITNAPFVRSI